MPSGLPDWSQVKTALDVNFSNDYAELAARLGSPFRFYRTGNVIAYTSFEDGDDYFALQAAGGSAICAVSTDKGLAGAKSLKMSIASTDASCAAFKNLPPHLAGIVALSFAIDITFLTNRFWANIYITKDSVQYIARIEIDKALNQFQILKQDLSDLVVDTIDTLSSPQDHQWMTVKLFVDSINYKYYALDINGTLFDLTLYPLYSVGAATKDQISITFNLLKPGSGTDTIYLDNVVYTINDPI